jgi:hypothetical protein
MNFIIDAIKSNKEVFYGIIGGFIVFTCPVLIDMYVRPLLHTLY